MSRLLIKRIIPAKHLVISTDCPSGKVSMLVDETGDSLIPYQQVLSGRPTTERFTITLDDQPFTPNQHTLIGFGEKLPEKIGMKEYLLGLGAPENDIEALLQRYDLTQHSYLSCAQLPATQSRQLQFIALKYSNAKVVIVNDPFQPFSGRWREQFAEELVMETTEKQRIAIVMNLSFLPKVWDKNPHVSNLKIGNAGRKVEKPVEPKPDTIDQSVEKSLLSVGSEPEDPSKLAAYDENRDVVKVPTVLIKVWKVPKDYIIEPLAKMTQGMRSLAGALALSCLAFLVVLMGVVMFPQLSEYRNKLVQIATKFNPNLGERLAEAISSAATPVPDSRSLNQAGEVTAIETKIEMVKEEAVVTELETAGEEGGGYAEETTPAVLVSKESTGDFPPLEDKPEITSAVPSIFIDPGLPETFAYYCSSDSPIKDVFSWCDLGTSAEAFRRPSSFAASETSEDQVDL